MSTKFGRFFAVAIISFAVISFSSTNKIVFAQDSDWTTYGSDMYTHADVTGNIGIGLSNPGKKCDMKGPCRITTDNDVKLYLKDTTSTKSWSFRTENDHDFQIYDEDAGSARLHIASDGDIGIGTTSPGEKLEVTGDIKADNINNGWVSFDPQSNINNASDTGSYTIVGNVVYVRVSVPPVASSVSPAFTFTLPVTPSATVFYPAIVYSNTGGGLAHGGMITVNQNSTTASIYADPGAGPWSNYHTGEGIPSQVFAVPIN
jgi:hypothetical protein